MMMSPVCAKEAFDKPPNIPGCPETQSDMRRNLSDVALDHLERAHFGRLFRHFRHLPTPIEPQ